MSKYSELSKVASERSKEFHAMIDSCRSYAGAVFLRYAKFLEAPDDSYHFFEVDRQLEPVKHPSTGTECPELVFGGDGWWYLGFAIRYQLGNQPYAVLSHTIGIAGQRDGFRINFADREFDLVGEQSEVKMFEAIRALQMDDLKRSFRSRRRYIGFYK